MVEPRLRARVRPELDVRTPGEGRVSPGVCLAET